MNNLSKAAAIVACGVLSWSIAPAKGAITFLDHFNSSSSFDINPANGDYAAGDSTATTSNSPTTDTGFFPGSTPANLAFKAGATSPSYVDFNSFDGNIQFTGPTSGGITVGAWVKFSGSDPVGRIFTVGSPDLDDDFLMVDYGNGHPSIPRAYFRDGGSSQTLETPSSHSLADWTYLAVTVDLTNSQMNLYLYDTNGNAVAGAPVSVSIPVSGWNLNNPAAVGQRIRIGGPAASGSIVWVDEFSIDDQVLSSSQISARVSSMVAGNQIAVPEPASIGLLLLGGIGLLARRRRSAR